MSIQKTDYKEPEHVQKEEELKGSFFHAVKLFDQTKVPRKAPFPVDEYGGARGGLFAELPEKN